MYPIWMHPSWMMQLIRPISHPRRICCSRVQPGKMAKMGGLRKVERRRPAVPPRVAIKVKVVAKRRIKFYPWKWTDTLSLAIRMRMRMTFLIHRKHHVQLQHQVSIILMIINYHSYLCYVHIINIVKLTWINLLAARLFVSVCVITCLHCNISNTLVERSHWHPVQSSYKMRVKWIPDAALSD